MNKRSKKVYQAYEMESLWADANQRWVPGIVVLEPGQKASIGRCGNAYEGPCPYDIIRPSDVGRIRIGLRTKNRKRAVAWLERRRRDPSESELVIEDAEERYLLKKTRKKR